jgi:hypothetical protein
VSKPIAIAGGCGRYFWSENDKKVFFSAGFMRREWFLEPPQTLMVLNSSEEFYLRPALEKEKFPSKRTIELPAALATCVEAQEWGRASGILR